MRSLAAAVFAASMLVQPALAQAPDGRPSMMQFDGTLLSVSADAEVKAAPDTASVNAGVSTQGATAEAAMAQNASRMSAVIAALRKAGVAERDIQTSGLSLNPQYQYNQNEAPKLTGYEASNMVTAKIRAIKNVGKTLDALVAVGSNQIHGVSFSIDKPDPLLDEARRDALAKARARAEMYAAAVNMKIMRIVAISEGGGAAPMPMFAPMARAEMKQSTPIAPGELTLSASVNVTFALR